VNGHPLNSDIYKKLRNLESEKIRVYDYGPEGNKSKALNKLARVSNGEFVALIDVDDFWEVNKLIKQIPYIEMYDVVGTNCIYFGDRTGDPNIILGKIKKDFFSFQNPIINSSVIIKKNLAYWNENNTVGTEDYELWLELAFRWHTFYNVPENLVHHRLHGDSNFNNKNLVHSIELRKKYFGEVPIWVKDYIGYILHNKRWEL
jgi:cellulose synthase/poly-beta-1,6-N-acetylglucosamine synthase-like glycosyltransferase